MPLPLTLHQAAVAGAGADAGGVAERVGRAETCAVGQAGVGRRWLRAAAAAGDQEEHADREALHDPTVDRRRVSIHANDSEVASHTFAPEG